jgi:cytochrome P450
MVGSAHVPKYASFEIVAAVTSLNPLIWGEDAESLKPDHWDNLTEEQSSSHAFATFSNGPRICIGRQFAFYEIKTILV